MAAALTEGVRRRPVEVARTALLAELAEEGLAVWEADPLLAAAPTALFALQHSTLQGFNRRRGIRCCSCNRYNDDTSLINFSLC